MCELKSSDGLFRQARNQSSLDQHKSTTEVISDFIRYVMLVARGRACLRTEGRFRV